MGLHELRKARGLTLEAFAYLADVDIATISRIERRLVKPRRETVVRLARALGMSVGRLVRLLDEPEEGVTAPGQASALQKATPAPGELASDGGERRDRGACSSRAPAPPATSTARPNGGVRAPQGRKGTLP